MSKNGRLDEDLLYLALEPTRKRILFLLKQNGGEYIARLADTLNINSKIAQFHLNRLEHDGLLESNFEVVKSGQRPTAGKVFRLTELGQDAVNLIRKMTRPT